MKKSLILSSLLFIFLGFNINLSAQKPVAPKEIVAVTVSIPEIDNFEASGEIQINSKFSRTIHGGGFHSIYECGGCKTEEEFKKAKFLDLDVSADAIEINKNRIKINLRIVINDYRSINRSFVVLRNRKTNFKLKHGAYLTIFYPYKNEKEEN